MDLFTFPFPTGNNRPYCSLEKRKNEQEIHDKSQLVRAGVCVPKCIFSRTCGKRGQAVLDCIIVIDSTIKEIKGVKPWEKN